MTIIEKEFEEFYNCCIGRINDKQKELMSTVFHAGAFSMFTLITKQVPTLSDENAERVLQVLDKQIREYCEQKIQEGAQKRSQN